jgi:hypothetical protein
MAAEMVARLQQRHAMSAGAGQPPGRGQTRNP